MNHFICILFAHEFDQSDYFYLEFFSKSQIERMLKFQYFVGEKIKLFNCLNMFLSNNKNGFSYFLSI